MYEEKLTENWIRELTNCGSLDMIQATAEHGLSPEDLEYHLDSLPDEDRELVDVDKLNRLVVAYCVRRLAE